MSSSDLERVLLADPGHLDPHALKQLQQDSQLREALARSQQLDRLIHQAMQVAVPASLEQQLLMQADNPEPTVPARRRFLLRAGAVAAAASAAAFGLRQLFPGDLSSEVIAHIQHEPASLMTRHVVTDDDLRALLADYDLSLHAPLGRVTYLARCRLRGKSGIHLVLDTDQGKVTVFLIPGLHTPALEEIRGEGLSGYLLGIDDRLSLAIVGRPGQPLMPVERRIRSVLASA